VTIPVLINFKTLIDEQKCYETVRQLRWTEAVYGRYRFRYGWKKQNKM
jgi:hypothetical protein